MSDEKPWEAFAPKAPAASSDRPWEEFGGTTTPEGKGITGHLRDTGVSLLKGAISLPEMAVGLADIPTGGRVGKFLENDGGIGFQPKDAKAFLDTLYTDQYKAQQKQFQNAEGIADKTGVALSNPSLITNTVAESLPTMLGGGVIGRGVAAVAPRVAPVVAGAIGEGAAMAGSQAESIRQQSEDGLLSAGQSLASVATGGLGGLFGYAGARFAKQLGLGDVDTMLASGVTRQQVASNLAKAPAKSVPRQVVEGAITEGFLEELPQSVSEQVIQNLALGRDWSEGVNEAIVMGTLAGMAMGGPAQVFNALGRKPAEEAAPEMLALPAPVIQVGPDGQALTTADRNAAMQERADNGGFRDVTPVAEAPQQDRTPLALPAPVIKVSPSGEALTSADRNAQLAQFNNEAEQRQIAEAARQDRIARGEVLDITPIPKAPTESEQMGIDPNAGPMSSAAALAVDSGATRQLAQQSLMQDAAAASEENAKQAAKQEKGKQQQSLDLQAPAVDAETGEIQVSPQQRAQELTTQINYVRQLAKMNGWTQRLMASRQAAESELARINSQLPAADEAVSAAPEPVAPASRMAPAVQPSVTTPSLGATDAIQKTAPGSAPVSAVTTATDADAMGAQWASMTPAQRKAVANKTDIKGVLKKNLHNGEWQNLGVGVKQKLADQMQAAAAKATKPAKMPKATPVTAQPPAAVAPTPTTALDAAAHEAATSPLNDRPEPTDAQKEAGNYAKGHVKVSGMDITIENPRGSERKGKREDGSEWSHQMSDHYGYIKRTKGADGEQVDVYVGPKPDEATHVYVVDQLNQKTGGFDEHKAMLGFNSEAEAVAAYSSNFDQNWKVGKVTAMTQDEFKTWLAEGDTTRPVARLDPDGEQEPVKGESEPQKSESDGAISESKPKKGEQPPTAAAEANQSIKDFGEKIGGARKDRSTAGAKRVAKSTDERPAWARRYEISQVVSSSRADEVGRWTVTDTKRLNSYGQPKRMGDFYATEEEAKQAVPLLAVGQKHRVVGSRHGESTSYEIWRDINDRKRVKVVDQVFDTREAALEYMAKNAQAIIETNTTFGEADLPRPDSTVRTGSAYRSGPAKDSDFMEAFGFRGVEFGNWNNQEERQQLLDDAFDGLMDLAEVMDIPPRAISLNGELALAFGARGQGLSGARAHYERYKAVINLTKMNGAGSLAHEWWHALDHYFGRQDGKASAEWVIDPKDGTRSLKAASEPESDYASGGFRRTNSGVREEVRAAYDELMRTLSKKAEQYVEDTAKADNFVARSRKDVADRIAEIRRDLTEQKDPKYWKRNNKPATAEQLAEFDTVAQLIIDGTMLETEIRDMGNKSAKAVMSGMRWTNDALEKMSAINKAVRGRSGFSADSSGQFDRLRSLMNAYSARLKMLSDAQAETSKTKMVPTDFAMHAKELDQGRGGDYWTTPHEMAARAFQGYVEDKIAGAGGKSPFLNHGPANAVILTPWGWKRPFPFGEERKAINKAFDKLIDTLETKEGDAGQQILFSRSGTGDATSTPEFRRWFGDSKVVDDQGKPLVVYHGTDGDFTVFDPEKSKDFGMHFGSLDQASTFVANGGSIKAVHLKIERPLELDFDPTVVELDDAYLDGDYHLNLLKETLIAATGKRSGWKGLDGTTEEQKTLIDEAWDAANNADEIAQELAANGDVRDLYGNKSLLAFHRKIGELIQSYGHDGVFYENQLEGAGTSYIVFKPEQIKSATGNNGQFDPANPDIRYSFAGPSAVGADMLSLARAQQQVNGGRDPEIVRQQTGWHRGTDGKWRFEISDDQARLARPGENFASIHANGFLAGDTKSVKVGDVLEHDRLFAAYPHLRDLPLRVIQEDVTATARFRTTATGGSVEVAPGLSREKVASAILHELQHGIQLREGFARGGSRKAAVNWEEHGADAYQRLAGEVEARNTQARILMNDDFRRMVPPSDTADVAPADVIVTFNGRDVVEAPAPQNVNVKPAYVLTPQGLSRAFDVQFPRLAPAVRKILNKGQRGERGGAVVINSNDPLVIARTFANKTGRKFSDAINMFSGAGVVRGFYDPKSGLTFLVGPNLDPITGPAVLLHEMVHGQQRQKIDAAALNLVRNRAKETGNLRAFLDRVADRMVDAGETGNAQEAAAYIVEQAIMESRSAGHRFADSRFLSWVDSNLGQKIGNLLRSFIANVRQWMLRNGLPLKGDMLIDDLVQYAMAGVESASFSGNPTVRGSTKKSQAANSTAVRLFHGGNKGLTEIKGGTGPGNIFGGIFASKDRGAAESHGDGSLFQMDVPAEKILMQRDLDFDIDYESQVAALRKAMPWLDEEDVELAARAVLDDKADELDEDDLNRVFREDSAGESSWEAQRIRGKVAQALGYQAVEMSDEHGTSYLVLPGTKVSPAEDVQMSRSDVASTPEFKRWFGDSKVVDDQGKPLVVYHGARPGNDIAKFKVSKSDGAYFTPDINYAEGFTEGLFGDTTQGAVYPAFLSIKNPYIIKTTPESSEWERFSYRGLDKAELQAQGYDGAMLYLNGDLDQIIAFDPAQIKSATGNNGQFDPANPDIRFSQSTADVTTTKPFKNWFKQSVVTETGKAGGKPLVMYHGTGERFTQFAGDSFYFTQDQGIASTYGDNLMPVYLSIQKPLDLRDMAKAEKVVREVVPDGMEDDESLNEIKLILAVQYGQDEFREWAEKRGYDGLIMPTPKSLDQLFDMAHVPAYVAFRPEQVKSANGNNGKFDPVDPDIRFSRSGFKDLASKATAELNRTFDAPGKLSKWHTTFGTMYNLAKRSAAFKPVFEAAQGFIDDVAYYAADASELAPKLLPKLETWKDIFKSPISAADNKAIAAPIFEGTLVWARDLEGNPVRVEDMAAEAANLTTDQKAAILLARDMLPPGVEQMWRAQGDERFAENINTRYESQVLKAGVVWTDGELREMFKLNDAQVELYHEFREATNRSLDTMARADMLRFGGDDVKDMKAQVMDASNAQDAARLLRNKLAIMASEQPSRADQLMATANGMIERADTVTRLQSEGYAPLSRFGKYTVDVVVDGDRKYFGLFETKREANAMAEQMRAEFGAYTVSQGTLSDESFKLFAGITPESLELFGSMLGLNSTGDDAQDRAFQEYIKLTKTNRSAMRRLIHRKGIAGFSEDVGRVLASFVYSNARQTAAGLHMGDLGEALNLIPKEQGELKDAAVRLAEYIKNPQEEAQAMRGLLFAQYLGGSVASAFVNMTQPFAVTFPWLSQYGGAKKAAAEIGRAAKNMSTKGYKYEDDLAAALKKAEDDGVVSPQEVHQLMAQARGSGSLQSGDGTKLGNARATAQNSMARFSVAWGKLFGAAEQVNRRITFIASYRVAKDHGIQDPARFARDAVRETQFVYSKASKMQWGRGAVGGTLMTFKTYSVAYLELMSRLWSQGEPGSQERKDGRKAVMLMVATLMLMGGAGGLPFAEDAEDLIDGAAQLMGYNFSAKKAKEGFLTNVFGDTMGRFMDKGISGLPGAPLDVSGRLGMGNLIPGTGLLQERTDHGRDILEIAGPAGDFAKRVATGSRQILSGEVGSGLLEMAPTAIRNAVKGGDMAINDMYRDTKGYKVLDTNTLEAALKSIGFQPNSVARVQESNWLNQRSKAFYSMRAQEIRSLWATGIFEKDQGKVQEARDAIADWNAKNPDQPMQIRIPDIMRRVREMNKSKDQRIADTAPKAMRQQMREDANRLRSELD